MSMDMASTTTNANPNSGTNANSSATPPAIASMTPEQRQARIKELQSDPGVQQALQLKSARDASWSQMMKMYGNYIMGTSEGKGKKKSGGKSKGGDKSGGAGYQENPVALLQSNDPHDKARGYYMLAVKVGPPDDYRVRQLLSEESQQLQKLNEGQRKLLGSEQELSQNVSQDKIKWQQYLDMDQAKMSPEQKAEFERLNRNPLVNPTAAKLDKKTGGYPGSDGKYHTQWQRPDGSTYETIGESEERKPVSETKPIRAWAMDDKGRPYSVEVDPQTNQIKKGTENYDLMPPSNMMDSIKTGEFSWKDENNVLHRSATTTVTSHSPRGRNRGSSDAGAGAGAASNGSKGDRVIGSTGPTGQTKSRADAAKSIIPLIDRARELMQDPEVRNSIGPLAGRWDNLEKRAGNLSGKLRDLAGTLISIYSLGGTMHGWRSIQVAEKFRETYGDLTSTPDSLEGGLKAMEFTAKDVYHTGYNHPYDQQSGVGDTTHKNSTAVDPNDPAGIL